MIIFKSCFDYRALEYSIMSQFIGCHRHILNFAMQELLPALSVLVSKNHSFVSDIVSPMPAAKLRSATHILKIIKVCKDKFKNCW